MYLIRNVFHAKPAKARELAAKFTNAAHYLPDLGVKNTRVLTDVSATFWMVVIQSEVEDLNAYVDMSKSMSLKPEVGEAMKGYHELVDGGYPGDLPDRVVNGKSNLN